MSKIHEALQKVKEERHQAALQMAGGPGGSAVSRNFGKILMLVLFASAACGSVAVNGYTIRELGKSRAGSGALAELIQNQNEELKEMRADLAQERREAHKDVARLQEEVKTLKSALAAVEDLKLDNRLLLVKLMALNDKVKKISEMNSEMNVVNGE